mmetsp:Transcript_45712/g.90024  ORF Transcript_45712/g.90024 Transcript_45712/m.90024 type:complete len:95 (-) Transcript_45712:373-657(-)
MHVNKGYVLHESICSLARVVHFFFFDLSQPQNACLSVRLQSRASFCKRNQKAARQSLRKDHEEGNLKEEGRKEGKKERKQEGMKGRKPAERKGR